jgi:hypothetical protein
MMASIKTQLTFWDVAAFSAITVEPVCVGINTVLPLLFDGLNIPTHDA